MRKNRKGQSTDYGYVGSGPSFQTLLAMYEAAIKKYSDLQNVAPGVLEYSPHSSIWHWFESQR